MRLIDIKKILVGVMMGASGVVSAFAEIGKTVFVEQDGYACMITECEWNWLFGNALVELCKIDDSVIEAAIKADGVLKMPDEVTYDGKSYNINRMRNVLGDIDGLKTVALPRYMVVMECCLEGCADLSSIIFSECLKTCMLSINNLPSLTALDLPESFGSVGEASLNGLPIKEVNISHIKDVQKCSCGGWLNVKRLVFPSDFLTAEMYTFGAMPNLEEIVLPEVVEYCLSPNMFSGCTNVRRIYARSITPPALGEWGEPGRYLNDYGEGFFSDEPTQMDKSTCVLYVPEGSAAVYRENEYWGRFKHIVEYNYGGVDEVAVEWSVIDRLRVADGKISVPGSGEAVTVSDLNGRCVYQGRPAVDAEVAVSPGIYVVRVGGDVRKVSVR